MLDLQKEKRDAESFIADVVKQLEPSDKQRVADIIAGFALLAIPKADKSYSSSGVPAQCG